jgi:hypothetical protein
MVELYCHEQNKARPKLGHEKEKRIGHGKAKSSKELGHDKENAIGMTSIYFLL